MATTTAEVSAADLQNLPFTTINSERAYKIANQTYLSNKIFTGFQAPSTSLDQ